ncbi:MAG: hypothetical protein HY043_00870 [Verrucomicrobia bacterium]|nr:hypothetical protein [Verrucomicrobiota bacterium]
MKTIIAFLFSVMCLFAADDIGITTTVKTNAQSGAVITKEFFTRAGKTNLLRSTTTTNGVLKSRLYRFYHDGKLAADHLTAPGTGYLLVATQNGFDVNFEYRSNVLSEVVLADKDDNVLDAFVSTNGVLTPIPTSELRKMMSTPDTQKEKGK